MQELYKKMYASLVCQVDKSITDLTNIVLRENCEKDHICR